MAETVLRAGIIGCGGVAARHVRGYRENGVAVTALADVNAASAEAMGCDLPGVKCFTDADKMLAEGLVDLVSVCTPPSAHEQPACAALRRHVPVLLEKPLAHSVPSGRTIVAAAEAAGTLLMTAFRHRFLPAIRELREIITAGKIGPVVFLRNVFCGPAFAMKDRWFSRKDVAGGGTMMDTSSHSVDLFRFLVGEVVEQKGVAHRHLDGTDVEDASVITLKAANGALGSLTAAWVAGQGDATIDIMGQTGRVTYDYTDSRKVRLKTESNDWVTCPVTESDGFAEQIGHFLRAVRGEEKLSCTGRDGLRALEIIQSIYAVAETADTAS